MTFKPTRGVVTALCLAGGLALTACADERPYPVYNNGVAYYPAPAPAPGTSYAVPSGAPRYYPPSAGTTYDIPSGATYYAAPPSPCANCNAGGGAWYRYHDGQWHVD
jgi:hypothetical protein